MQTSHHEISCALNTTQPPTAAPLAVTRRNTSMQIAPSEQRPRHTQSPPRLQRHPRSLRRQVATNTYSQQVEVEVWAGDAVADQRRPGRGTASSRGTSPTPMVQPPAPTADRAGARQRVEGRQRFERCPRVRGRSQTPVATVMWQPPTGDGQGGSASTSRGTTPSPPTAASVRQLSTPTKDRAEIW